MPIPTLAAIIREIESSNDPYAWRYEPRFSPGETSLSHAASAMPGIDADTIRIICASSWGLYQIMGDNLYGPLGLTTHILKYVSDLALQDIMFHAFLTANRLPHDVATVFATDQSLLSFARAYNGPGDPEAYVAAMQRARSKLFT